MIYIDPRPFVADVFRRDGEVVLTDLFGSPHLLRSEPSPWTFYARMADPKEKPQPEALLQAEAQGSESESTSVNNYGSTADASEQGERL